LFRGALRRAAGQASGPMRKTKGTGRGQAGDRQGTGRDRHASQEARQTLLGLDRAPAFQRRPAAHPQNRPPDMMVDL
jgi:hypothetical protein